MSLSVKRKRWTTVHLHPLMEDMSLRGGSPWGRGLPPGWIDVFKVELYGSVTPDGDVLECEDVWYRCAHMDLLN